MARYDPVHSFVRDALSAGRSRSEVAAALRDAGWSGKEVELGLAAYADTNFMPPVPRPRPVLTARDAFVYAVLFTALAFTAVYLINLIHANLTLWLPDPADNRWITTRSVRSSRWAIAILLISTPVYLWMTMYTRRQVMADEGHKRSLVRKWLTYGAMFASVVVFLGDASYVIYHFLSGEMTTRLLLKALTVAAVAGAIFAFYRRQMGRD